MDPTTLITALFGTHGMELAISALDAIIKALSTVGVSAILAMILPKDLKDAPALLLKWFVFIRKFLDVMGMNFANAKNEQIGPPEPKNKK